MLSMPVPLAAPLKAWLSGRSLALIAGSSPAVDMDVSVVLRRADHSSWRVLSSVVCPIAIEEPQSGGLGPLGAVEPWKKNLVFSYLNNKRVITIIDKHQHMHFFPFKTVLV